MRIVQQTIGSAKITWRQIKKNSSLNSSPESHLGFLRNQVILFKNPFKLIIRFF